MKVWELMVIGFAAVAVVAVIVTAAVCLVLRLFGIG